MTTYKISHENNKRLLGDTQISYCSFAALIKIKQFDSRSGFLTSR